MESLLPATLDLTSAVDAVLLSHPHKDHYGLANLLPGNPPVFGGEDCLELVRLNGRFFDEPIPPNLHPWHHKMPFAIGPFTITPFLTDHSAVDAYMLLIECARRKVLYSGDFRMTGRKSRLVGQLIHQPPRHVDILLLEGTTLGRTDSFPTETEVEDCFADCFRETRGRVFVTWSAQNIDRTVSLYRACLKSGRILVIDQYCSCILDCLKRPGRRIPALGWKGLKCVVTRDRNRWFERMDLKDFTDKVCVPNGLSVRALQDTPKKWAIFIQSGLLRDFQRNLTPMPEDLWIYSMWQGYLADGSNRIGAVKAWFDAAGVEMKTIHTSGHAAKSDLLDFCEGIAPKVLIPIHSFDWDNHLDSFPNAVRLNDGEPFDLS